MFLVLPIKQNQGVIAGNIWSTEMAEMKFDFLHIAVTSTLCVLPMTRTFY